MKYKDVMQATNRLEKNGVKVGGKVVFTDDKNAPGLKLLGAISFLVNHHGYTWANHKLGKM